MLPVIAAKNIFRAGVKTWLNAFVLSLSFVIIIWLQGLYEGMNIQVTREMINAELGGGQYWVASYDPYDPFTIDESHSVPVRHLEDLIQAEKATGILISRGMIYTDGRAKPILVKGIEPSQKILSIPAESLKPVPGNFTPVLIGTRMAKSQNLEKGDIFTIQWRDANGAFDARYFEVAEIMKTNVQTIDNNQVWMPLEKMRDIYGMKGQSTIVVLGKDVEPVPGSGSWVFKSKNVLLKDIKDLVQSKTAGSLILYMILIFLAMIAVFDTQVLSIFKRKKEIGMLMALGMTRKKVMALFTMEGVWYSILALCLAVIYGTPLLYITGRFGWALPAATDSYGFAFGERLFPYYSAGLIAGTIIIITGLTTLISFIPARKIAGMSPTQALRGSIT